MPLNLKIGDIVELKAGEGYKLQIDVTYKTNALTNQPEETFNQSSSTLSGSRVSNLNTSPNVYKDVYVQLPDEQIISATGIYSTTSAFNVKVLNNK